MCVRVHVCVRVCVYACACACVYNCVSGSVEQTAVQNNQSTGRIRKISRCPGHTALASRSRLPPLLFFFRTPNARMETEQITHCQQRCKSIAPLSTPSRSVASRQQQQQQHRTRLPTHACGSHARRAPGGDRCLCVAGTRPCCTCTTAAAAAPSDAAPGSRDPARTTSNVRCGFVISSPSPPPAPSLFLRPHRACLGKLIGVVLRLALKELWLLRAGIGHVRVVQDGAHHGGGGHCRRGEAALRSERKHRRVLRERLARWDATVSSKEACAMHRRACRSKVRGQLR